ncbi:hypothetical protein B0O99DRAFT_692953 [Bisporella sp. PMI_857]|nr:hypothetical protein B0O99DRAFT_692953 [Bisporella sp. PMI_857]
MQKPQILIGVVPVFGHYEKMLVIGAGLIHRGYHVTVLTASMLQSQVEASGARFVPLKGRANFDFEQMHTTQDEVSWELENWVIRPIKDQHECLQHFLKQAQEDNTMVIYIDDHCFGAAVPAVLGAPGCLQPLGIIKIGISPMIHESVNVAPFGLGLAPLLPDSASADEEARRRNQDLKLQAKSAMAGFQTLWEETLASAGVPGETLHSLSSFPDSLVRSTDLFLQMGIPELEYPRSDPPSGCRFLGALPSVGGRGGKNREFEYPSWWNEVIHSPEDQNQRKRPIVVVSQGSLAKDPSELIFPTLDGLRDLDVTVIATLMTTPSPGLDLPPNARVAEFIPFNILFEHTAVLVSNAGFGAVQQALSHGVPMVLAGQVRDFAETSARAAWAGAAINLRCNRPEPHQVREAVVQILESPAIYERCRYLREQYARYDAIGLVAAAVDELATR